MQFIVVFYKPYYILFTYTSSTLVNLGTQSVTINNTALNTPASTLTSGSNSFTVYAPNGTTITNVGKWKNFTVVWWNYTTSSSNDTPWGAFKSNGVEGDQYRIVAANFIYLLPAFYTYSNNVGYMVAGNNNFSVNTWYHFATSISYNDSISTCTMNCYQNGVNIISNSTFIQNSYTGVDSFMQLGTNSTRIYKFSAYNYVLSQSEIQELYAQK
jgi:hypothetical protein